jgi:hypothetical protein
MLPPSINIRMSRSSALISYTDISPEEKPMPTTSIAGDCVRDVIEHGSASLLEDWRRDRANLWIQVLSDS